MKIVCISDTHNKHDQVTTDLPSADAIVHAGDITGGGFEHEVRRFLNWYSKLDQYKYKILIAGNHDFFFQDCPILAREILKEYPNIIYLENEEVIIDGIKFYGSPQQPRFFNWAFNVDRGEKIKKYWDNIPNDTDILITHGPAYGYGDLVINSYSHGERVGCEDLLNAIKRVKPHYHICGHVHSGYGKYPTLDTIFINAAVLGEDYQYVNFPITIEIKK